MFINCPYCRALVATDPVTDLPPTHCPQCGSLLRRDATVADDEDAEPAPIDLGDLLADRTTEHPTDADPPAFIDDDALLDATMPADADDDSAGESANVQLAGANAALNAGDGVAAATATSTATAAAPTRRGMPSFARAADASAPSPERWLPVAVVALALLLILQLLLADRARLAADAAWRPTLAVLCAALSCNLPPWREPGAFTLLQRDVRQHPSMPGALRVSATFRNDARWSQPWPRLRLKLSDANGRPAGERSFGADEYLGGPPGQPELASGEAATVAMDILEPAPQIVAYDFSFL